MPRSKHGVFQPADAFDFHPHARTAGEPLRRIESHADAGWEAVAFAYGKGSASLLDLLSAQRSVNDLRLAAIQATADAIAAAIALRSAGENPQTPTKSQP